MAEESQIILIKKKKAHHGHHGGAWKVAYADFVTAMMALFIVLWLMNTSKPTQEAVGGYFRDPKGTADKKGTDFPDAGNAGAAKKDDMSKLEEKLVQSMQKMVGFDKLKNQIEMKVTPEGLRIELLESPNGTFFENGKAQPTSTLASLLKVLSVETGKLPNPVSIEGHTDAKPYASTEVYSNWELSTDRANMARRLMESSGLRPGQVIQVRGYADHNLRKPEAPLDASNRRISVIIEYGGTGQQPAAVFDGVKPIEASSLPALDSDAPPSKPSVSVEKSGKPEAEKAEK